MPYILQMMVQLESALLNKVSSYIQILKLLGILTHFLIWYEKVESLTLQHKMSGVGFRWDGGQQEMGLESNSYEVA